MGKGHTGLVIAARMGEEIVALKIRRVDADRDSLETEADCLRLANSVSVGPKFLIASRDLLAMELVEGDYLVNWVDTLDERSATLLQGVFIDLLEKTRRLDETGLDHGELSKAHRHIIVTENGPRIIDFESASSKRRCSNVTSLGQYLFFNRQMREAVRRIMKPPERKKLIEALSSYKREPSLEMFRAVLEAGKLVA